MSGTVDRYRRFLIDGSPIVTGFLPVGDAWACTNPSAGRGLTVGLKHAVRLRDVVREAGEDPYTLARRFHEVTEEELAPWYHAQIAVDRARFAQIEALREGREPPPPADDLARRAGSLFATMAADPDLFRAGLEYIGTITPLQAIFERPDVVQKVTGIMEARQGGAPPQMPGPGRDHLLALMDPAAT